MRNLKLILALPVLLFTAVPAIPHAHLDRAEPRVGSTVATAPREVTLWFTERLEPAFSTVTVSNAAGQRVDAGKARASGNVLRVSLKQLPPGSYSVSWRVRSVDSHRTQGDFRFQVGR